MPRTTRSAAPLQLPPALIAGIIRLAEPDHQGIPADFVTAWNAMPELVRRTMEDHADDRYGLINDLAGITKAERHAEQGTVPKDADGRPNDLARGIALLYADSVDNIANVTAPVSDAAFYVGICFAAYIRHTAITQRSTPPRRTA